MSDKTERLTDEKIRETYHEVERLKKQYEITPFTKAGEDELLTAYPMQQKQRLFRLVLSNTTARME